MRKLVATLAALVMLAGAASAQVTVLAFGDSLTQGFGLPEQDGFVPQLQAWLRENGAPEAVVVNGGVSGDTTQGGLARIGWALSDDIDAVVVALGGNDLLRGLDPGLSRRNLDGILDEIDAKGLPVLLVGLPAPANFGPDYMRDFEAIYPALAEAHGALLYPNFLAGLDTNGSISALRDLMQGDGLHPNTKGVARIVADIGPHVLALIARVQAD